MCSMQETGEWNSSIVEMHENTKAKRGAPEKQEAKHDRGNSTLLIDIKNTELKKLGTLAWGQM